MTTKILMTWIGNRDLETAAGNYEGLGPIAGAVTKHSYSHIYLLSDYDHQKSKSYTNWLSSQVSSELRLESAKLSSPTCHEDIYREALRVIDAVRRQHPQAILTYHLSPGTPAMASIWLLLAKTIRPAKLIESSKEAGVRPVSIPFDLAMDYIPSIRRHDEDLLWYLEGLSENPDWRRILHQCAPMKRAIAMARRFAIHDVPVLIQGESGTGKELFARAMHSASTRADKPFETINCGAIPDNLVDSELFGHAKDAFTGANRSRDGLFQSVNGGTLFLDEIGEMPLATQVKLLRALQEGKIRRVGSDRELDVNVRIIAATNRNLAEQVSRGLFREDLWHRLTIGILKLPPLRDRPGDLNLLVDSILADINSKHAAGIGWKHKKISAGARNLALNHSWPGNVRELRNTLLRAAIWSPNDVISKSDMDESLTAATLVSGINEHVLNRPLGNGFDIQKLLSDIARRYLTRALEEAGGNKTQAAALVGLPSYQTLSNWCRKYGLET